MCVDLENIWIDYLLIAINFFNIVKFNLNKNEYLKYLKSNEIYNSYVYMNRICLSLIYILHYRY